MSRQHSHGNDWPHVEVLSEAEKLELVEALSAPEPGVVITVPLMLLALYMQVHGIEPKAYERQVLIVKKQES